VKDVAEETVVLLNQHVMFHLLEFVSPMLTGLVLRPLVNAGTVMVEHSLIFKVQFLTNLHAPQYVKDVPTFRTVMVIKFRATIKTVAQVVSANTNTVKPELT
tara:strand:+ start:55 stop:360 length:306 start_codon:yes stop_codon:yes gene_type:complete